VAEIKAKEAAIDVITRKNSALAAEISKHIAPVTTMSTPMGEVEVGADSLHPFAVWADQIDAVAQLAPFDSSRSAKMFYDESVLKAQDVAVKTLKDTAIKLRFG
jgi:hypothetical protein